MLCSKCGKRPAVVFVSNNNFRDELKNFNKIVEENGMSLYEYRIEP